MISLQKTLNSKKNKKQCELVKFLYSDRSSLKPIFHQNVNPLELKLGGITQSETSLLAIPTCWCPRSLADPTWTPSKPNANPLWTQSNPTCEQVEYGCIWSPHVGARIGHVEFMLFVSISFVLGSQH